jgi:hypothetical protein
VNFSDLVPAQMPTRFPVMSGDGFLDGDGTVRPIEGVSVVLTSTDGTEVTIALERRAGGRWWVPRQTES